MTIAFVCPDSFADYETVEKELSKYDDISKIICATSNAYRLAEVYTLHNNCEIKTWLVKDGGPEKRLRTMIERADKVILFEFIDYDKNKTKYSRTQYALNYAKKLEKDLYIINYNREENRMKSATALFRERKRTHNDNFRHSESRWNALVQMIFIWISKQKSTSLNVYKSQFQKNKDNNNWLKQNSCFNINNWNTSNSIVEGDIVDLLNDSTIKHALKNKQIIQSPDLVLIEKKDKKTTSIALIEVKTVGAGIKNNIKKYRELVRLINAMDYYTCELYYLVSYGHEDNAPDWKSLEDDNANIILWEELFLYMQKTKCPLLDYITPLGNIDNWQKFIDDRFTDT